MIDKAHYISDGNSENQQLNGIRSALDAGQKWVQFRFKNTDHHQRIRTAEKTKKICDQYAATLIINDHIDIATEVNADGIHLGLSDARICDARKVLKEKIIGGTANTLTQIFQRQQEGCDYIGLGPYRFTSTKKDLQPILGLEGYKSLLEIVQQQQSTIPIIAIGGIQLIDIHPLLKTGVYGVAFSGLLHHSIDKHQTVLQLNNILYGTL